MNLYGLEVLCRLTSSQWSIGALKKNWEARIDDLIRLFVEKMTETGASGGSVVLSDKVAYDTLPVAKVAAC